MKTFPIRNFDKGVINNIEQQSIPDGAASDSRNWLTLGDRIELSGGYDIIGTENAGTGRISGLKVSTRADGTKQIFRTRGKKLEYYDLTTLDWVEVGSDQLGTAADGEDISFTEYITVAGNQTWLSSPNSSLYKIMTANPGSINDQYNSAKNYKGFIRTVLNWLYLWNIKTDKTGIYRSYIDAQIYTTVSAENVGTGNGATLTFTDTLAFKGGGAKRTCFGVLVTDGVETFTDNFSGGLTGSAGGTGTINYTTGALSVTFAVAPLNLQAITCDYSWEDSTNNGIADFTFSTPRTAAQGDLLREDIGGAIRNIFNYAEQEYVVHDENTWRVAYSDDDLTVSNRIFRERVGIKNWRAAISTGDGIFYIDTSTPEKPYFRRLTFESNSLEVLPSPITLNVDLAGYVFDQSVSYEWGDYILFFFKSANSSNNDTTMVYHKIWKSIDILNYYVSCAENYGGTLLGGDSLSNNVQRLFTGFTANGSTITNYWVGNLSLLQIEELKKFKRLTIKGQIDADQSIDVFLSYDNANFVQVGTISGSGDYVSATPRNVIGSPQVAESEIGGGGTGISAYDYTYEMRVRSPKFDRVKIKFMATNVGYASVSEINYYDIQLYGQKNLNRFRTT